MPDDLFANAGATKAALLLTVFQAQLLSHPQTSRRGGGNLLGVPGLAVCRAGRPASAPGRHSRRHRPLVRLDLRAVEQEMGLAVGKNRGWWQKLLSR